jgi:hypothetical protein
MAPGADLNALDPGVLADRTDLPISRTVVLR